MAYSPITPVFEKRHRKALYVVHYGTYGIECHTLANALTEAYDKCHIYTNVIIETYKSYLSSEWKLVETVAIKRM